MIVKQESLEHAARRTSEFSESEEGRCLVLYAVQRIYNTGELRYFPVVRVGLSGNRRTAKAKFRKECDEAISSIMNYRIRPKLGSAAEWERPTLEATAEQYVKTYIPQAVGWGKTMLRQMWLKLWIGDIWFAEDIATKNNCEFYRVNVGLCIIQGDREQMKVVSQHFRRRTETSHNGTQILKEVEIPHCANRDMLEDLLDYLDGHGDYRITRVGRWAMLQEKKTRKVAPIFSSDHFASLDWMDQFVAPDKAKQLMSVTVEEAMDHVETDMSQIYEMYYTTLMGGLR